MANRKRVRGFEEIRIYHLAFDGQTLVYTSGAARWKIVLIENFRQVTRA
jgi:hypothetical protein